MVLDMVSLKLHDVSGLFLHCILFGNKGECMCGGLFFNCIAFYFESKGVLCAYYDHNSVMGSDRDMRHEGKVEQYCLL
jgi:hypothetical protein